MVSRSCSLIPRPRFSPKQAGNEATVHNMHVYSRIFHFCSDTETCLFFYSQAKVNFMKYAAPLFHLSGMDVTVVEVGLSLSSLFHPSGMDVTIVEVGLSLSSLFHLSGMDVTIVGRPSSVPSLSSLWDGCHHSR